MRQPTADGKVRVEPTHTEEFELADGRMIERPVGIAHVTVAGRRAAANVIFSEPGESTLLGVVTLEELGFVIDPAKGELKRIHFRLGRLGTGAAL